MHLFRRTSIRKTLQMVILVASSTGLLTAVIGFSAMDWFASKRQLFEQLRAEASIVANNSLAALTFDDVDSATRTLTSLKNEGNIIAAALYNNKGELFASFEKKTGLLPAQPQDESKKEYEGVFYKQLPIFLGEEQLGYILLLADHRQWLQTQLFRILLTCGLIILSLMLALLISTRLQRLVTKPVLALAKTARTITEEKDYRLRAEVLSDDEIGHLAADFNQMLEQIQIRDEELKLAQEHLEEKVKERTKELESLAHKLEHQAYHDALTGLANRITFDNRLREAIGQATRSDRFLSVMFLDLDRFKMVNDTLGHDAGDQLLIEVAGRLKACLRDSDTLARLGGDEFAILLNDVGPGHTGEVASKVLQNVCMPLEINGHNLQMSTSIGIAVYPGDGDSAATILKNADTAMYRSKESGRNRITFFAADMNARVERRLLLESRLRQAVKAGGFSVAYQAKWCCNSHRLTGVEALIRWRNSEEGDVSPEEFIPLAEDCGVIIDIDLWVMEQACLDLLKLHNQGRSDLQLSVNFSPRHFSHPEAYKEVANILERTGYPGDRLELEITESLFGPETDNVLEQLTAINNLGVEISIDDFGTAYSSLSRLKQLPLHTLKIDRAFIRDVGKDVNDETLVKTIITMAHNLNLKVVAEGVETQHQHNFVVQHQCDLVQGFLFSKPIPFEELEKLIQQDCQDSPQPFGTSVI